MYYKACSNFQCEGTHEVHVIIIIIVLEVICVGCEVLPIQDQLCGSKTFIFDSWVVGSAPCKLWHCKDVECGV